MNNKNNHLLSISIIISAIMISGSIIYSAGIKDINKEIQVADVQKAITGSGIPEIDDDVVLGNPEAPITFFVFSDYQCPFSGKFFKETELQIRENYVEAGKVKMVFKDLAFLGPESIAAAQAAECARDQGKYWAFHDAIFNIEIKEMETLGNNEYTENLNQQTFEKIASDLNMNIEDFKICFESQKYADEVKKDTEEAKALMGDYVSTPTIFVNENIIQGAYPYETFSSLIEETLNKN
ncbi:thioredoxin domain-containing protein [Candidatus Wolfebacteria bacterium]|nr:thioredoxin domain-containing protein [Candidatus Wolfebacteria bacterium]